MKKLKIRGTSLLAGMVLGTFIFILFPQGAPAKTLSEALEAFKILEFKEKMSAPDFQLKDLQGNTVSLKDYKGKPIFMVFWTTW